MYGMVTSWYWNCQGVGKYRTGIYAGMILYTPTGGEDTRKQYYVTDTHGNVVQLIDGSGEVIRTYDYDSFGNEVGPESGDENPFRYCGEYYDRETGEVYLRARYYQPETGRFLTRDTYTGEAEEPLSLHLYTYCENDGVNGVDPSGHDAEGFLNFLMYVEKFVPTTKLAKRTAGRNYIYNKKHDIIHGMIYDQNDEKVKEMLYGEETIGNVGCELIAIYNIMKLKNKPVSFADIIYESDFSGHHVATGRLGTNPYEIGKMLTQFDLKYSLIKKQSKLKRKMGNNYILSFWNRGGVSKGLHTIAVHVAGKKAIVTYNDGVDEDTKWKTRKRFKEILEDRQFIIAYKVK